MPNPSDFCDHQAHYCQGDIECIDAIKAVLGPEGFHNFCIGCAMKYVWRHKHKDGKADLDKAMRYLEMAKHVGADR